MAAEWLSLGCQDGLDGSKNFGGVCSVAAVLLQRFPVSFNGFQGLLLVKSDGTGGLLLVGSSGLVYFR